MAPTSLVHIEAAFYFRELSSYCILTWQKARALRSL